MALNGVVEPAAKVVVAIDFGTTYSGFSYAHMHLAEQDRSNFINTIACFEQWPSMQRVGAKPYCKTQTSLLYVPKHSKPGEFELKAWGWTAFHERLKLLQQQRGPADEPKTFHFITNFKLALAGSTNDDDTYKLPEGFTVQRVVSDYLQQLSILIEEELKKKYGAHVKKDDIQWCLTVPAIWDNVAKEEMKRCAEIAGLVAGPLNAHGGGSQHPVVIVLEPEAAAIYCLDYMKRNSLADLPHKCKILVVDAGGGTVDLTFHEQVDSGNCDYRLKEISGSSGDLCGATFVDDAFYKFLSRKIICFDAFIQEHPSTTLKIREIWENLKVNFEGSPEPYFFWLPAQLRKYWERYDREHETSTPRSCYDELNITSDEMKSIFDSVVHPILDLIDEQLDEVESEETKTSVTVMVVGGFSSSPYLKTRIREEFTDRVKCIVFPTHPGRAVVTGAVVYGGIGRGIITSRVARMTYGLACLRDFHPTDPLSNLVYSDDGRPKCKDVFHVYAQKGAHIPVNYCQKIQYIASNWGLRGAREDNDHMKLEVYTSDDSDPVFVTDPGSMMECTYAFPIPSRKAMTEVPRIEVCMYFGRATIEVSAEALNFKSEKAILPKLTFAPSEVPRTREGWNLNSEVVSDLKRLVTGDIQSDRSVFRHWKADKRTEMMKQSTVSNKSANELEQYVDTVLDDSYRENVEYALFQLMRKMHVVSEQNKNLLHQVRSLEMFTVAEKRSSVPRFVYPDVRRRLRSKKKLWKLKDILDKLARESAKLRFLCEAHHKDHSLHEVQGQEGLEVKAWKAWVKVLVPCVIWSLKIVFLAAIVTSKAAQFSLVLPVSLPFSWYESVGRVLPSVTLSESTSAAFVDLFASIDVNEFEQSGGELVVDQITDQEARRESRKALSDVLKKLTPQQFERKVGLTKVALKDSHGRFNDVAWICKPCLQEYRKCCKVEILD